MMIQQFFRLDITIIMKKGKTQILQTLRGSSKFYLSIVEKENDSGIFFNQRIFFLASMKHIGYISEVKISEEPQTVNFQKPKTTILLTNIKSIVINEKQISIKFYLIDGDKKSERIWLLRMETQELAKKWYDLLQKEKVALTSNVLSKKPSENSEIKPSPSKIELSEKKNLQIVKNIQLSQTGQKPKQLKETKEFKEIGIGVSPRHAQSNNTSNQLLFINSSSKQVSPEEKLNTIMKQNDSEVRKQKTPNANKANNSSTQNYFPSKRQEPTAKEQVFKHQPTKPASPKKEPIKKQQIAPQIPKQRFDKQPQKSQPVLRSAQKQPQQTSQQITKAQQVKSPTQSNINSSSSLVNTKYLDRKQQSLRQQYSQQMNTSRQNPPSRHYLQRTHQIIRSLQESQSNRSEPKIVVFQQKQSHSNSIVQESKISETDKGSWNQLPWTYKYIKYGHLVFKEFQTYTQQLMQQIVNDLSKLSKKFKPKLIKNNIHYYDIKDIEVKLAFISLQEIQNSSQVLQTERVCNKRAIKKLQNQFNNFKALYEYCENGRLKVALSSLCEYNSFVGLFKVTSKHISKNIRLKQIQQQLLNLQRHSKMHIDFKQQLDNIIIQLDDKYYDACKTQQEDKNVDFHLFIIQEVESFLLPDLVAQQPQQLLRKELVEIYRTNTTPIQKYKFFSNTAQQTFSQQLQTFSKNIFLAISDLIIEMDSFSVYFMNSKEFSKYMHSKGINIRYLGHLYQNLKTLFQKRFVMTEMAARSCKSLFRKTLQDVILLEEIKQGEELHSKICDFLNCVLGNTYETAAIWKVLSTHSRQYFGFQLNFDQIDRGHFVISLIQQCRLNVVWDKIRPQQAFKSNIYFTQNNLLGLRCTSKSYISIHSKEYKSVMKIIQGEEVFSGFQDLVNILSLREHPISPQLSQISSQIIKYLSFFISPAKAENQYSHLHLYENTDASCPSRIKFDLLLMQIKWFLKLKERDQYIKICDYFIRLTTKYYGQFHPIFSELYELFSAYHLTNSQFQDAITFAKSSLVNILKICGTNHEKTSQFYYHLGLCYIKCSKSDEAVTHIKKALSILENNNRVETVPYAIIQLKLALLYLNKNQIESCVRCARDSLVIFDAKAREVQGSFQNQIVQCLQILNRSYELLQMGSQGRQVLQQCEVRLANIHKSDNLEKLLKIYLHPILSGLSPQKASNYLDIISLLSVQPNEENYQLAYKFIRERIKSERLLPCLLVYLEKLQEIEGRIRQSRILYQWQNFSEVYERQTLKDFTSLSVQLLTFLGEGYMCGCLREAL